MPDRYVIADEPDQLWGHIFRKSEETVRFVYDRETEGLAALQIAAGRGWRDADRWEAEDVLDSLRNANPDALDRPEEWGLGSTDELPDWARSDAPAP